MFSFFSKKKSATETAQEEALQGLSDGAPNSGMDDFIFVEKKDNGDPARALSHTIYPSMPSGFSGVQYPTPPYPPQRPQSTTANTNQLAVPYVQDVPFVLAPQLRVENTSDLMQMHVDGVLAMLTRQISVDERNDYNFALERSIRNECF